jgi:hypothetical protein
MLAMRGFPKAKLDRVFGRRRNRPKIFRAGCSHLQHLYEPVLERELDKRNFRKRVFAMDLLIETDEVQQDVGAPGSAVVPLRRTKIPARDGGLQFLNFEDKNIMKSASLRQVRFSGSSGESEKSKNPRRRRTKSWSGSTPYPSTIGIWGSFRARA